MSVATDYPKRLFKHGLVVSPNRSINHHCKLNLISNMIKGIGEDAYVSIKDNSCLGMFLKLADSNFKFTGRHIQYLLAEQLRTQKKYELWVLIGTRPLRFSLVEFQHITHLNCGNDIPGVDEVVGNAELWAEIGLPIDHGPTWGELKAVLEKCRPWSFEKRRMIGLLVVLHVGVYGCHPNSRLPYRFAKLVGDSEKFEMYPWGRVAFAELMSSIRVASYKRSESYTIHGFVHSLLIWAFEAIPLLGEMYGSLRSDFNIPILQWKPIRKTVLEIRELVRIDSDSTDDGKVRVKHFLPTPPEGLPGWSDEREDPRVDNMVKDILGNSLDESFWRISKKRKRSTELERGRIKSSSPPRESSHNKKEVSRNSTKEVSRNKKEVSRNSTKSLVEKNVDSANDLVEKEVDSLADSTTLREVVRQQKNKETALMIRSLEGLTKVIEGISKDQNVMADRLSRLEDNQTDFTMLMDRVNKLEQNNSDQMMLLDRLVKLEEARAVPKVQALEAQVQPLVNDEGGVQTKDVQLKEGEGQNIEQPANIEANISPIDEELNSVRKALF